jgi:uncharacterized phage-associated protein
MGKININEISVFYIYHAIINGVEMSHLKLQKVLYYTQAYHLVYFNKANIFDDEPEAWVNGPVYRPVYDNMKRYGTYNVIKYKEDADKKIEDRYAELKAYLDKHLTEKQIRFIDSIFNRFGLMSHEKLVFLTHREAPWNEARKGLGPFDYSNEKISFESMYNFYSKVLEKKN